jgi:hypothetical protein
VEDHDHDGFFCLFSFFPTPHTCQGRPGGEFAGEGEQVPGQTKSQGKGTRETEEKSMKSRMPSRAEKMHMTRVQRGKNHATPPTALTLADVHQTLAVGPVGIEDSPAVADNSAAVRADIAGRSGQLDAPGLA